MVRQKEGMENNPEAVFYNYSVGRRSLVPQHRESVKGTRESMKKVEFDKANEVMEIARDPRASIKKLKETGKSGDEQIDKMDAMVREARASMKRVQYESDGIYMEERDDDDPAPEEHDAVDSDEEI